MGTRSFSAATRGFLPYGRLHNFILRQFQSLLWETGNINLGLSLVIRFIRLLDHHYIFYFVYRHSSQLHLLLTLCMWAFCPVHPK